MPAANFADASSCDGFRNTIAVMYAEYESAWQSTEPSEEVPDRGRELGVRARSGPGSSRPFWPRSEIIIAAIGGSTSARPYAPGVASR